MRYTYIKDKHGSIEKREEWVFKLFDHIAQSQPTWIEKKAYQNVYDELKMKMIGGYINDKNHKYNKYLQELVRKRLIKAELLDYVLVNNLDRSYFEKIMAMDMGTDGIVLGVAFPWVYPGTEKKTGAEAVHQIFIWDLEAWLEKTSKWYWKLFHWKRDYEPLHPELTIKGLIYHELIHARQYIIDHKREPARRKDGTVSYRNHLEKEAYALSWQYLDAELGYPEHLERWNAKTYEEAADNYLKYLTSDED